MFSLSALQFINEAAGECVRYNLRSSREEDFSFCKGVAIFFWWKCSGGGELKFSKNLSLGCGCETGYEILALNLEF